MVSEACRNNSKPASIKIKQEQQQLQHQVRNLFLGRLAAFFYFSGECFSLVDIKNKQGASWKGKQSIAKAASDWGHWTSCKEVIKQ